MASLSVSSHRNEHLEIITQLSRDLHKKHSAARRNTIIRYDVRQTTHQKTKTTTDVLSKKAFLNKNIPGIKISEETATVVAKINSTKTNRQFFPGMKLMFYGMKSKKTKGDTKHTSKEEVGLHSNLLAVPTLNTSGTAIQSKERLHFTDGNINLPDFFTAGEKQLFARKRFERRNAIQIENGANFRALFLEYIVLKNVTWFQHFI